MHTGTRVQRFTLEEMIEEMIKTAAQSGHADTVEMLLLFGQQHNIATSAMVAMDTIGAALEEEALAILLKF